MSGTACAQIHIRMHIPDTPGEVCFDAMLETHPMRIGSSEAIVEIMSVNGRNRARSFMRFELKMPSQDRQSCMGYILRV